MAAEREHTSKKLLISVAFIVGVFLVSMSAFALMSPEVTRVNLSRAWEGSRSVAMALDQEGHPNVAYLAYAPREGSIYSDTELTYAHIRGGSVKRVKLADLNTDNCEIAILIDRQQWVHVFAGLFHEEKIVHSSNVNGHWETSIIPLEGYCSSIRAAIDPEDRIQIMYVEWVGYQDSLGNDFFRQCLRLLTLDNTGRYTTTITETEVNGGWLTVTAFKVDSRGFMHFLYTYSNYSGPSGGYVFYYWLYYLNNEDGIWSTHTFISGSTLSPGRPSFVLDSQDRVHICYYKPTEGTLEICHAGNVNGAWEEEDLGIAGDAGSASSIALDRYGGIHLLYYNSHFENDYPSSGFAKSTLMYASLRDNATLHSTIEKNQWGFYSSADVAVDAEGVVRMFYHYSRVIPPSPSHPEGRSESYIRYASDEEGPLVSETDLRNALIFTTGSCAVAFLAMLANAARKNRRTWAPKS